VREVRRSRQRGGVVTLRTKESALELVGFDPAERRMVVLRALVKAQRDHETFVTFKDIKDAFSIEEGEKSVSDPLLYRSLASLEKDGFIVVDRAGYRHRYSSSHKVMRVGLEKAKEIAVKELERRVTQLESEIEELGYLDSGTLASQLVSEMTGRRVRSKAIFVEGLESCFSLIEREICKKANRGDIIRYTTDWMRAEKDQEDRIVGILNCLGKSGAETRILCRSDERHGFTAKLGAVVQKLRNQGHNIELRRCIRQDATYQFVSKSGEGMVLIVAEEPLAGTWISRDVNTMLMDAAIEGFSDDYVKAEILTE
jgi:DNA-binding PadR family transcriptional regulator